LDKKAWRSFRLDTVVQWDTNEVSRWQTYTMNFYG
jgi:hypothetical protein